MASKASHLGITLSGALMGSGLVMSGMTSAENVLGFLDVIAIKTGHWNPSLLFVLGSAVLTTFVGYRLIWRMKKPICESRFQLPTSTRIDAQLVSGAALFGIGWGMAGYCPGPAIANLAAPSIHTIAFMFAMVSGMALAKVVQSILNHKQGK